MKRLRENRTYQGGRIVLSVVLVLLIVVALVS